MCLFQKLAKSEEEDIAGTYFKPQRATRIMAQAQETKRNGGMPANGKPSSTTSNLSATNLSSSSNLSSSFNSGLNTFGLNNSYTGTGSISANNSPGSTAAAPLSLNGNKVNGWGSSNFGNLTIDIFPKILLINLIDRKRIPRDHE